MLPILVYSLFKVASYGESFIIQFESKDGCTRPLRNPCPDQPVGAVWLLSDGCNVPAHLHKGTADTVIQQNLTHRIEGVGANAIVQVDEHTLVCQMCSIVVDLNIAPTDQLEHSLQLIP